MENCESTYKIVTSMVELDSCWQKARVAVESDTVGGLTWRDFTSGAIERISKDLFQNDQSGLHPKKDLADQFEQVSFSVYIELYKMYEYINRWLWNNCLPNKCRIRLSFDFSAQNSWGLCDVSDDEPQIQINAAKLVDHARHRWIAARHFPILLIERAAFRIARLRANELDSPEMWQEIDARRIGCKGHPFDGDIIEGSPLHLMCSFFTNSKTFTKLRFDRLASIYRKCDAKTQAYIDLNSSIKPYIAYYQENSEYSVNPLQIHRRNEAAIRMAEITDKAKQAALEIVSSCKITS